MYMNTIWHTESVTSKKVSDLASLLLNTYHFLTWLGHIYQEASKQFPFCLFAMQQNDRRRIVQGGKKTGGELLRLAKGQEGNCPGFVPRVVDNNLVALTCVWARCGLWGQQTVAGWGTAGRAAGGGKASGWTPGTGSRPHTGQSPGPGWLLTAPVNQEHIVDEGQQDGLLEGAGHLVEHLGRAHSLTQGNHQVQVGCWQCL